MRTLLTLVAALALVVSVSVDAQGRGGGGGRGNGGGGPGGGPGGPGGGFGMNRGPGLAEFVNAMKLDDSQKEKVKEIFDKEKEAYAQWDKDNEKAIAELRAEMQNAPRGDQNAMQAMREKMQEKMQKLQESRKPIQDDTVMKLGNVLTFEQMQLVKQRLELQAMDPTGQAIRLLDMLEKCDLTADQRSRIQSMVKETAEKAQAARTAGGNNAAGGNVAADPNNNNRRGGGPGGAFQLWRTLEEDIMNNVLTTEQKAKFAEQQRANRPQGGQGGGRGQGGGPRGGGGGGQGGGN